jgi:hypothetical protein
MAMPSTKLLKRGSKTGNTTTLYTMAVMEGLRNTGIV